MISFVELDERTPLSHQFSDEGGPVVLVAKFTVDPSSADQMVAAWKHDAEFFLAEPGCISAQLHRGIAGSGVFLNYAVWESTQQFRRALTRSKERVNLGAYPEGAKVSLHLFRKVPVAGVCLG